MSLYFFVPLEYSFMTLRESWQVITYYSILREKTTKKTTSWNSQHGGYTSEMGVLKLLLGRLFIYSSLALRL